MYSDANNVHTGWYIAFLQTKESIVMIDIFRNGTNLEALKIGFV